MRAVAKVVQMDGFSFAMIRWGLRCGTIDLQKVPAEDNCADIVTKCLVGEVFKKHRAAILGLKRLGLGERGE